MPMDSRSVLRGALAGAAAGAFASFAMDRFQNLLSQLNASPGGGGGMSWFLLAITSVVVLPRAINQTIW